MLNWFEFRIFEFQMTLAFGQDLLKSNLIKDYDNKMEDKNVNGICFKMDYLSIHEDDTSISSDKTDRGGRWARKSLEGVPSDFDQPMIVTLLQKRFLIADLNPDPLRITIINDSP
ncbi:hypothetical protein NECAME_06794 [Necator americanus]|uniref:Uncharacterized protein n=1 Tax=Necator americanus TaxID=51031 RepID=W2TS30_NECAM|nr:hypothetical protein NECAME_06794 [Necator americanus]ETN84633.1 hypothetical protein NECAME_06794 [Necator americanus]